jgi:hypothetical protein
VHIWMIGPLTDHGWHAELGFVSDIKLWTAGACAPEMPAIHEQALAALVE